MIHLLHAFSFLDSESKIVTPGGYLTRKGSLRKPYSVKQLSYSCIFYRSAIMRSRQCRGKISKGNWEKCNTYHFAGVMELWMKLTCLSCYWYFPKKLNSKYWESHVFHGQYQFTGNVQFTKVNGNSILLFEKITCSKTIYRPLSTRNEMMRVIISTPEMTGFID